MDVVVHEAVMIDFDVMLLFERTQFRVDELFDEVILEQELLVMSTYGQMNHATAVPKNSLSRRPGHLIEIP